MHMSANADRVGVSKDTGMDMAQFTCRKKCQRQSAVEITWRTKATIVRCR
jgi:hypothetical protein